MATEEFIKRSILGGKPYDALPARIKAVVPLSDWKFRVKEHCIHRGYSWGDSMAKAASPEGEYYEDLLEYYMQNCRIYPYHLADYISRIMRVSPFKYNSDILYSVIREEKSYDFLPNFTAADIVRLVGVGRNEYIAIINKCKAKKLLWRVSKSVAKDLLPTEPLDIQMQPWWQVNVVNLGETEYRQLQPAELQICQDACRPRGLTVGEVGQDALQPLYKQGLIYLSVPIQPSDHISIPPLEGFVSNKNSEKGEDKGDPLEAVLYSVFVATSERASVAQLASILSVDQARLQAAISVACLLGFANRLSPIGDGSIADDMATLGGPDGSERGDASVQDDSSRRESETREGPGGGGQGIALVVDAEVTSYLMMGALSPGLKRHSVTLFEGGRVTGSNIISDLIQELHASVEAASQFEGEMQMLAGYSRALATALECLQAAGGGRPLELLRKEPLANLAPSAARRVLSHAYAAVVSITPLPSPPLPLTPHQPGPTNFGATLEASTPWLQLALYSAAGSSPVSLVVMCGQRFWRLPPQLSVCTHALLWPWDPSSVRAQGLPIVVENDFLLFSLNEHLSRTALVVQPVVIPASTDIGDLPTASLPLPLLPDRAKEGETVVYRSRRGEELSVHLSASILEAVATLGLTHAVGCLQLMQVAFPEPQGGTKGHDSGVWVPLNLQLGLPLQPDSLCQAVCKAAASIDFLGHESRAKHTQGQLLLQDHMARLASKFGCVPPASVEGGQEDHQGRLELPTMNLQVEGGAFRVLDLQEYLQGPGTLNM